MTVMADVLTPRALRRGRLQSLALDGGLILLGSLFVALTARVTLWLPFTPVPITGQTFGVLLCGALLGPWRGGLALLAYLSEGLMGLPVFAGGTSAWSPSAFGVPVILGPTAGYLFGFVPAAFFVGLLASRGWDRSFWRAALAMVAGEAAIYALGLPWLARYVGPGAAISLGLLPFIPGDILKLLLASALLPAGWRILQVLGAKQVSETK